MASSSIITSQLKKIVQRQSKYAVPFCNANQDPLSIRRSELLQELCKAHKVYQSKNEAFYDSEIGKYDNLSALVMGKECYT